MVDTEREGRLASLQVLLGVWMASVIFFVANVHLIVCMIYYYRQLPLFENGELQHVSHDGNSIASKNGKHV
ncbi:hypothetical protein CYMTET_21232 [Cymbomonas tetramitiformis]|uniref:Uncharacterized protein n=1 Tax=Cymbomonas tetramitiformis TaxID=36881 RepID=A0AAE0G2J8_9CHLO|nr:hypothetical protein CYMTET_21232 [Cymbomonas tetramitiformis]